MNPGGFRRWRGERLVCLLALTAVLCGLTACRRKDPATSGPSPNAGGPVSDGILEGFQREIETARRNDPVTAERVKSVHPVVNCVEEVSATEWRAHFGYENLSKDPVALSVSVFNRFWPPPLARKQPQVFVPGSQSKVVQATFNPATSTAWILGSAVAVANAHSTPCAPARAALK